ncbi:MAG: AsmA-like C-terminal region-containing protein [Longimicrobiales bacterium]
MIDRRRLALTAAAIVASLFLVLATLPLLFRDDLAGRVRVKLDSSLDARVDWSDVGLSMLRDFPNLTLLLDDVAVSGAGRFAGDTLVTADRFRLVLDLGSVLRSWRGRGPLVVRAVELTRPSVRLTVLEDGAANWRILREREPAPRTAPEAVEPNTFDVSLRDLTIRDGTLVFENRRAGLHASLMGLDHSSSGDLRQERITFRTRTRSAAVRLRFAGIPYLAGVALDVRADLVADLGNDHLTIEHGEIRLNDLALDLAGSVGLGQEQLALDLAFAAPGTAFGEILSLVPALYARDFAALRTDGTMSVSGHVRGDWGANAFPAFALDATVEDGAFRYPALPLPARDIKLDLSIRNSGGDADSTIVELRRFHALIGGEPIEAALTVRTPVSDPAFDVRVAGTLDLADVGRTIALDSVNELKGVVAADVAIRAELSDVAAAAYDSVSARGSIDLRDFALRAASLPHALRIDTALLRLSPGRAELAAFRGAIGSSDLRASGYVENPLGFALLDDALRGSATVHSERFDLNEWRSDGDARGVLLVPARLDLALRATIAQLRYGALDITDAHGTLRIRDRRLTLDDFRMGMLGGSVAATGFYETTHPGRPTFAIDLDMADLDIPAAFAGMTTVQRLAPVARYAQGSVSADVRLTGDVGPEMVPAYDALSGLGAFETTRLVLQDFPALERVADGLKIAELHDPTLGTVASSFEIRDGRVHVEPFELGIGGTHLRAAGSHGVDHSLAYGLTLELPRSVLGEEARRTLAGLASRTAGTALDLDDAARVTIGVDVTGTVADPTLAMNLAGTVGSVRQVADAGVAAVEQRVDSVATEARRAAEARAATLVADAERQAATIREEAGALAATVRREGHEQADALLAQASGPAARIAAQAAANRLRAEADERADRIILEADTRADALVAEAKRRGEALLRG